MADDLDTLSDRDILLLTLAGVQRIEATLEGLGQSAGRDMGAVLQRLETIETNVDLARRGVHALQGVVSGADFLAHDAVKQLEERVEVIERRPRLVNGGSEG